MWSCSCLLSPHSTTTAAPTLSEPGKLHSDYTMHPHFPPKFGGGVSYSPKNMVYVYIYHLTIDSLFIYKEPFSAAKTRAGVSNLLASLCHTERRRIVLGCTLNIL